MIVAEQTDRMTRMARTLTAVTSQIFRCPGLHRTPPSSDNLGTHDLLYWILFLTAISGWLLFIYVPQRERIGLLEDRRSVLETHLKIEKKELKRLQIAIADLCRGEPVAWERVARQKLGYVAPGEQTDMMVWNSTRAQRPITPPPSALPTPPTAGSPTTAPSPNVTRRPSLPALPVPSPMLRTAAFNNPVPTPVPPPTRATMERPRTVPPPGRTTAERTTVRYAPAPAIPAIPAGLRLPIR